MIHELKKNSRQRKYKNKERKTKIINKTKFNIIMRG